MQLNPSQANNFAYAKVRLQDRVSSKHAQHCFDLQKWTFDASADGRTFTLHIPVYSAYLTAGWVVESKLEEFSQNQVPLVVEEVRVLPRKIFTPPYATARTKLPAFLNHWKIATPDVPTGTSGAPREQAIEDKFVSSNLPGRKYYPTEMVLKTPGDSVFDKKLSSLPLPAALVIPLVPLLFAAGYLIYVGAVLEYEAAQLLRLTLYSLLFLGALLGWRHLAILQPRFRGLWSIASLSLIIAGSTVLGQLLISAWESEFQLPSETVNYPIWFRVIAAGYATFLIAWSIFLAVGFVGWIAYFGFLAIIPELFRVIFAVMAILLVGLASTQALKLVFNKSQSVISAWHTELSQHKTPDLVADFMYRACLEPGPQTDSTATTQIPLTVIEGNNGQYWSWDVPAELSDHQHTSYEHRQTTQLDSEGMQVIRLADNVKNCEKD